MKIKKGKLLIDQHNKNYIYGGKFGGNYVPETLKKPIEDLTNLFEKLRHDKKFLKEKDYYIAIVAEGVKKTDELKEFFEKKGIDVRVSILGHIQRGGNPTTYERLMAYEFINIAINI